MPRQAKPTPYHYSVELASPFGAEEEHHALLFLRPSVNAAEAAEAGYSFAEIIDAHQSWMDAATAAAVVLASDLDAAARKHRCRPSRSRVSHDTCGFDAISVEDPGYGLADGWEPSLVFIFPVAEAKAWRKRVLDTVERIRAARAWRPTPQEEADLSEYYEVSGRSTPTITSLLPERPATLTAREG
jgi:hypothetical protein